MKTVTQLKETSTRTHKEEEEEAEKQTLQDMIIHLKGHRIQLIFYAD